MLHEAPQEVRALPGHYLRLLALEIEHFNRQVSRIAALFESAHNGFVGCLTFPGRNHAGVVDVYMAQILSLGADNLLHRQFFGEHRPYVQMES